METTAKQTVGQPSQASGNIVKKDDVYMEDVTIVLPIVKNGVSGLGELWNCNSSETTHQNLFKKQLKSEYLIAHPLKKVEYSLKHIKGTEDQVTMVKAQGSMGLELLCGLIKVEGFAEYSNKSVRSVNEEKLICQYNLENFSISLLPIAKTEIDDHVHSQLMKGRIKATHVVYGVILGAEVNAHVLVTRNETKTRDGISGSAVGKLGFGKVTASLKAQLEWLDTSEANDYSTQIDIHSKPPMKRQPSTVKEMFEFVENIDVSVANEQHYKFSDANITGVPIRWVLVPVAQFLDVDVEKLYMQISETLLCDFRAMLISLQDSRQPECIKRRVLEKEHRLQRILSDSSSPLSQDISQYEKELNRNVESFFICACKALKDYKQAVITTSELHKIIAEYEMSQFSAVDIYAEVDKFVMDGKHELDVIHEKDATQMEAEICTFTNRALLNEWMNTESNIKILLQTKGGPSSGVFHRLFKISHGLKEHNIDVGIALPSISDNFSLTIKAREHQKCYHAADIPLILGIVSAAMSTDSSVENQFYTIMASRFNITLPLQTNELKDLHRLVELLKIDVHIASSYMECLECLWSGDSHWMFFVPIDALDTAYESIVGLRVNLKRLACANGKWVVGRLDIAKQHEAPLLFVLRDKEVKAICLDHLDIIILVDLFNKAPTSEHNEPDLSYLSPASLKCSIYHNRAIYAVKAIELMDPANHYEHNYNHLRMQSFEDNVDEKLTDALHIVRSCLSRVDMDVIAMVTHFAIRDNPQICSILEKSGWRNVDCSFGKDRLQLQDCELISTALQGWLSSRDNFLTKVKSAKVIIQQFQLTSGPCTDNSIMRVNNAIQLVTDDPECPEYIFHEIQSLQESDCHNQCNVFLARADDYVVSSENQDGMTHVKTLISILKRMYQNYSYFFNAYDAINIYVGRIDLRNSQYSSSNTSITQCIEKHQLHPLIQHLSKLQYNHHLVMLQLAFDKLKEANEPKAVVGVLQLLSISGLQVNQWKDLWTNSSFKYLIRRVIEDYDVLQTMHFMNYTFIPREFQDKFPCKSVSLMPNNFSNLESALSTFQNIITLKEIPRHFTYLFAQSIANDATLEKSLKEANALIFWKEKNKIFCEDWSLQTFKDAVDNIEKFNKDKESAELRKMQRDVGIVMKVDRRPTIDHGHRIAAMEVAADVAFFSHTEKLKRKMRIEVQNWNEKTPHLAYQNVLRIFKEELNTVPYGCNDDASKTSPCKACEDVSTKIYSLQAYAKDQQHELEIMKTVNSYVQRIRQSTLTTLTQILDAAVVRQGCSEQFLEEIKRCLKTELKKRLAGDFSDEERSIIVEKILSRLRRIATSMSEDLSDDRKLKKELEDEYEQVHSIPARYSNKTHLKSFGFREVEAIAGQKKNWKLQWTLKKTDNSTSENHPWLENDLESLPKLILKNKKAEHFENGMIRELKKRVERSIRLYEEKRHVKLPTDVKWEAHLFTLRKFGDLMSVCQDKWEKQHCPIAILEQKKEEFRAIIDIQLRGGFSSASEGRIIAKYLVDAIRQRSIKSGNRIKVQAVLDLHWTTNSEKVRLTYFEHLATQVDNKQTEEALQHFRHPNYTIEKWFSEKVDSHVCGNTTKAFKATYAAELKHVVQEIRNCQDIASVQKFTRDYLTNAEDLEYNSCLDEQDVSKMDISLLRDSVLEVLNDAEAKGDLDSVNFVAPSTDERVQSRLGCTARCFWCGALCWGSRGHDENDDDTKAHHSCHQPRGLHGTHDRDTKQLSAEPCNLYEDDSPVYWGDNCMKWSEVKATEFKTWKFDAHCTDKFDALMRWFFEVLHEEIAASRQLLPATKEQLVKYECQNLEHRSILAAIRVAIK